MSLFNPGSLGLQVLHMILYPSVCPLQMIIEDLYLEMLDWRKLFNLLPSKYRTSCLYTFVYFLRSADKVGRPFCCCIVFSFLFLFKVCRQSRKTFLFLFCFFLLFFFFFLIFLYRQPACRDFSFISQSISLKFGMLTVLDETNRLNIFSS